MENSDEALAQAAAVGDSAAFESLLERHYNSVFRLAYRLTGSREDAEDVTQEICASLPQKLAGFRAQARFRTWLWRIVVNAVHDLRRRRATHQKKAEGWGAWETARQAGNTETEATLAWLVEAMHALPADLRDTLALILDEMSHAQAAEVLGISEGTVSWRISKAKASLREMREREDQS
ncbi:MAG: RNA polymerase sigma factor [Pseudomonadota bacterium]